MLCTFTLSFQTEKREMTDVEKARALSPVSVQVGEGFQRCRGHLYSFLKEFITLMRMRKHLRREKQILLLNPPKSTEQHAKALNSYSFTFPLAEVG